MAIDSKSTNTNFNSENINISELGDNLIGKQIASLRARFDLGPTTDDSEQPNIIESYCHSFYRTIGFPVVKAGGSDFYNPGYYGTEDLPSEKTRRTSIDNNQDKKLEYIETLREVSCFSNNFNYTNKDTKLQYRLDVLQFPIKINILDDKLGPFDLDNGQFYKNTNRVKFVDINKILRPFKCVPKICNNVQPLTNKICAPFISDLNANVRGEPLQRSYLEFVARTRFSQDITGKSASDNLENVLVQTGDQFGESIGFAKFGENIAIFSEVESYIISQMIASLISICNKIRKDINTNRELASKIRAEFKNQNVSGSDNSNDELQFNYIDNEIAKRQAIIAEKDIILSYLPTTISSTPLNKTINCPLNSTFIKLVQNDFNNVKKEIDELNKKKLNMQTLFNKINKNAYYILGEICGIGLLDISAIMLALWMIPQENLLAMFDGPSFIRLYKEPSLRNSVVKQRYDLTKDGNSSISITQAMNSFDKTVNIILNSCSDIITSSNR